MAADPGTSAVLEVAEPVLTSTGNVPVRWPFRILHGQCHRNKAWLEQVDDGAAMGFPQWQLGTVGPGRGVHIPGNGHEMIVCIGRDSQFQPPLGQRSFIRSAEYSTGPLTSGPS